MSQRNACQKKRQKQPKGQRGTKGLEHKENNHKVELQSRKGNRGSERNAKTGTWKERDTVKKRERERREK